jgi:hypothetical protein
MEALRLAAATVMLGGASIYLGTGVTLVYFLFPIQPKLTPATYAVPFVGPIAAATRFLTPLTMLMLVATVGLIALELGTAYWIAPAVYLVMTIGATPITTRLIFPHNKRMAAGIEDPGELQATLTVWRRLCTWRAALWAVQWAAITTWFVVRAA